MIFILLFLFSIISVVAFFPPKSRLGQNIIYSVLGIVLIVVAGFRDEESVRDYDVYVSMFQDPSENIVEPTFSLISYLVHTLFGNDSIYLFIIYAILGVTLKMAAIKNLTELWFLSLLIYFSDFFILHEMTQIRAGVATALLLFCIKPIYDRNLKQFLLFALLAFLFHFSALVILPLWFLNNKPQKKWLLVLIPISYLLFFLGVNLITSIPIPGVQEKIELYQKLQEIEDESSTAINLFNLVFIAKIIIFYFLMYKYDLLLGHNKYFSILIKIYCISLISYPLFATIPAFATRINEFYGVVDIILIPFLCYVFKPVYFGKTIVVFIGLSLLLVVLFYVKLIVNLHKL